MNGTPIKPFDQSARTARALRDVISDYTFTPHDGSLICTSPAGDSYIVDPVAGTCSCEDHLYTASKAGGACKHVIAARHLALEQGRDLEQEAIQRRREEWKAEMQAERAAVAKRTAWVTDEMLNRVF